MAATTILVVLASAAGALVRLGMGDRISVGHNPTLNVQSGSPARVGALAVTPSGVWLAVSMRCVGSCQGGPLSSFSQTLVRSHDQGRSWVTMSALPATEDDIPLLLAGSDTALWLVSRTTVWGTQDAGRTWHRWTLVPKGPRASSSGDPSGFVAGGTAWLVWDGRVFSARDGGEPFPVRSQPSVDGADVVAAVGADGAVAGHRRMDAGEWFATRDRGATWSAITDPCSLTSAHSSMFVLASTAPDSSLWVVCYTDLKVPTAAEVVTSADGGATWQTRGSPHVDVGLGLFPVSATVAWLPHRDIYRTTDGGTHWTSVGVRRVTTAAREQRVPTLFVGIDADTAVYTTRVTDDVDELTVTTDGGRTWTTRPFLT